MRVIKAFKSAQISHTLRNIYVNKEIRGPRYGNSKCKSNDDAVYLYPDAVQSCSFIDRSLQNPSAYKIFDCHLAILARCFARIVLSNWQPSIKRRPIVMQTRRGNCQIVWGKREKVGCRDVTGSFVIVLRRIYSATGNTVVMKKTHARTWA